MTARHWLALLALGIIWGTTWVAADSLAEYLPPLHAAAARFFLASLLGIPWILWKRLSLPRGRALAFLLLLSFTLIALPSVLLQWARQHASSVTVTVLFAAMPLLLVMLAPAPRRAMGAAVVGLGGVALAVSASVSLSQAAGAAIALLAVVSTGVSALLVRRELSRVHPLMTTALLLGGSAVELFLFSLLLERGQSHDWNRTAIGSVLFLAVVAGAPAYALYFWLLQQIEAYKVVTVQWIQPLAALLEAAILLRLGFSFSMIAGTFLTLTSLLLVMRARPEDDDTVSLVANS
jgi:drug/metabolite transporter (DMT)-like permease